MDVFGMPLLAVSEECHGKAAQPLGTSIMWSQDVRWHEARVASF